MNPHPQGHDINPTTGHLGLSADQVLTTTRAVRLHLDFDRPVSWDLHTECTEIAQRAPRPR
ncbi:hypothetical protein PV341_30410 [Streptomyces sp. PA03-1a]|nr:hypothetical protein [Streptomyces sp. PA03-1a]MDX2818306.1 hypothetical protein [Streptomyces sp. PA03-5A]